MQIQSRQECEPEYSQSPAKVHPLEARTKDWPRNAVIGNSQHLSPQPGNWSTSPNFRDGRNVDDAIAETIVEKNLKEQVW